MWCTGSWFPSRQNKCWKRTFLQTHICGEFTIILCCNFAFLWAPLGQEKILFCLKKPTFDGTAKSDVSYISSGWMLSNVDTQSWTAVSSLAALPKLKWTHIHVMKPGCDTNCGNVYKIHTNLKVSVVCRNIKCQHFILSTELWCPIHRT